MDVKFSDLGISAQMTHELNRAGFVEPFEVQRETIPDMLLGKDVCCRAPTGSGKTLAFGIPMLERVGRGEPSLPKALILTPTRELAEQIYSVLDPIAWGLNLRIMSIYGGVSYTKQTRRLDKGVDIVVACPGRLLDLIDRGNVYLDEVEIVIIDEADRMADMGFTEPVCDILNECSEDRQTVMFSATLDDEVAEIREQYQKDPQIIEIGPEEISVTEMNHHFWLMPNSMKSKVSAEAIRKSGRGFIFCRTRAGVDRVAEEMENEGLRVTSIHGGMQQKKRAQAVDDFGQGKTHAIVATDVAARGLDIGKVDVVFNFELPMQPEVYLHRIGRTGRAGRKGRAISLVTDQERRRLKDIQDEFPHTDIQEYEIRRVSEPASGLVPSMTTIEISGGRRNKLRAGDFLGAITATKDIPGSAVGKINVLEKNTFVAIHKEHHAKAVSLLNKAPIKGKSYRARSIT